MGEKRKGREKESRAAPDRNKDTDWKPRQRADTKGQRAEPKCGSLISCRRSWQKSSEKMARGETCRQRERGDLGEAIKHQRQMEIRAPEAKCLQDI